MDYADTALCLVVDLQLWYSFVGSQSIADQRILTLAHVAEPHPKALKL